MPALQIYPEKLTMVLPGGNTNFQCCTTAGSPTPRIRWLRQKYKSVASDTQITLQTVIQISNVTSLHAGIYICIAENLVGVTSRTANLVIPLFPVALIKPRNGLLRLKSGGRLSITCNPIGYPKPIVTLHKDYMENQVT